MITSKKNKLIVIFLLTFIGISCSPKVNMINNFKEGDKKFYIADKSENTIKIKRSYLWSLDSITNSKIVSYDKGIIKLTSKNQLIRDQYRIYLSSKLNNKKIELLIYHGLKNTPIVRTYPIIDTSNISSEDLSFFKLIVVNAPECYESILYKVNGFYFKMDNKVIKNEGSTLTNESLKTIFGNKTKEIIIDSINIQSPDSLFTINSNIKISINYSNFHKYDCFNQNQTYYDFQTIISEQRKSSTIIQQLSKDKCRILLFNGLGSVSNVVVYDSIGNNIYNKSIITGEKGINNFLNFEGINKLIIKITGDYEWNGTLQFVEK